MGVDARMIVINRGEPLTERQVQRLSFELGSAFSHEYFWRYEGNKDFKGRHNACEVRYGGDSSGVMLEKFDRAARLKLMKHAVGPDARAYFEHRGSMFPDDKDGLKSPVCPNCDELMPRYGFGGRGGEKYGAWSCGGCGRKVVQRGDVVAVNPEKDF